MLRKNIEDKIVWIAVCLYISGFGYLSFLRYKYFDYSDFDLAVHAQSVWNVLHGSIHSSILGIDFLGNHANLILFLIAPVYLIFSSPLALLFIQAISLGITAFPLYLIAKKELDKGIALSIVFIYLLYPALGYLNLFEFHPTALSASFLVFMYYYFEKNNFKIFVFFMALSLMCQENISLIVFLFGIYAFFMHRGAKWALTPLLSGAIWFYLMVFKIIPYFNKDTIQFIKIYSHMGNSIPEILMFILSHPLQILKMMFIREKIIYLAQVFMPVSFLSLFDLRIFIAFPVFMQHLISLRQSEYSIYNHYTAEMIPFIFISAIYGIKRILNSRYIKPRIEKNIFILFILMIALVSNIYLGPQLQLVSRPMDFKKYIPYKEGQDFINMIPCNAGIVSTFRFLPRLSNRKHLYSFHHVVMGRYTLSDKPYVLPESAEYALIDFNDLLTFSSFYSPGISDINLRKFFSGNDWGIIDMRGNIVLLKKGYQGIHKLYRALDDVSMIQHLNLVKIDNNLEFLGYNAAFENNLRGEQIRLTLFWRAAEQLKKDYGNFIEILDPGGDICYRFEKPICYRIYPTYAWQKGNIISEDYTLLIPEDIKDGYSVKMGVFDYKNLRSVAMSSAVENSVYKGNMINLIDKRN